MELLVAHGGRQVPQQAQRYFPLIGYFVRLLAQQGKLVLEVFLPGCDDQFE